MDVIYLIIDSKVMSNKDSAKGVNIVFLRDKDIATYFPNKDANRMKK